MSGVMTKVAVYGFMRIVLRPARPAGLVVEHRRAGRSAASPALMGVLHALMQHDLKRLLAYHTVENIGIIFIGLGLALAFAAHGMPCRRGAGVRPRPLFHVFNHSLFKSLLFFGAGAVLTRDRRTRHGASRRPHPSNAA